MSLNRPNTMDGGTYDDCPVKATSIVQLARRRGAAIRTTAENW